MHPESAQIADLAARPRIQTREIGNVRVVEQSVARKRRRTESANGSSEPESSGSEAGSEIKRLRRLVEDQGEEMRRLRAEHSEEIRVIREEHRKERKWLRNLIDDLRK
jgi:hypothetical protein